MNEIREPIGGSLYDIAGRASSLSKLPQAPVSSLSIHTAQVTGVSVPAGLDTGLRPIAEEVHRPHESALWSAQT